MKEGRSEFWTNEQWHNYFARNKQNLRDIPWDEDCSLSQDEYQAIKTSIATFQLGEYAEGKGFKAFAREYVKESGDQFYNIALDYFIKEEQRHSNDLGRFMDRHHIPRLQKQWTDSIFRFLRHLLALELEIMILVSAEFIAKVYYRALMKATDSPVLKTICKQILADEVYHIHFQAGMLARLRQKRHPFLCKLQDTVYKYFFLVVILVVWFDHKSVFRKANMSFPYFLSKSFREINKALRQIKRCKDQQNKLLMSVSKVL